MMSRRKRHGLALVVALASFAVVLPITVGSGRVVVSSGSRCAPHFPKLVGDGFPEPRMLFSHNGQLKVVLRAAPGTMRLNHQTVDTMEFNGGIPGPTLVACPGDRVTVRYVNGLSQPTNLHVHGLHVSPQGDGDNVFVRIAPHKTHTYRYQIPLDQDPGAFWYHPHLHMFVDEQLGQALAGAIVIEGSLDNTMSNIPQALIVVQGGKDGGQGLPRGQGCHFPFLGVPEPPGCPPNLPGPQRIPSDRFKGPGPILVNGVMNPTLRIRPGQLQRWRIYNATAERFLRLSLHGQTFYVLANDGETLPHMVATKSLLIGPGSRREVLVRGASPGRYTLTSLPFQQCFRSCFDPVGGIPQTGKVSRPETVLTVVSAKHRVHERMPSSNLGGTGLQDLRKARVDVRRTVVFARMPNPGGAPSFSLNNMLFDANRVDVTMKLGSVEQWTLVNPATSVNKEWHNFHLHQNPFQVISINGRRLNYVAYEDTVALPPGSTVVIRVHPIDFTGKFVFHCHIAFHEDAGMMGVVQVVRRLTPAQARASTVYVGGMIAISSSAYGSSQDPPAATVAHTIELLCHPLVAFASDSRKPLE